MAKHSIMSRKFLALLLVFGFGAFILFPSCKKSNGDNSPSTASLIFNGTNIRFKSISAILSFSGASITGVWVGAGLPPLGSGVTSTASAPCTLPTSTCFSVGSN